MSREVKPNITRRGYEVALKDGTLGFEEWKKPSTPIYKQYFVFNLTNPEAVMEGAIPNVTQIGPEFRTNEVLDWNQDQSIVTYMPNRTYIFDEATSCAGCDDQMDSFVTVNIPLLLKNMDLTNYTKCLGLVQLTADIYGVKLFQRKRVREFLWGYTDDMLEAIVNVKSDDCPSSAAKNVTPFVQIQKNNTYFGISAVHTGQDDISKVQQFTMWRHESLGKYTSYLFFCSDGTQFAPRLTGDETLYTFSPEICRSISFTHESRLEVKKIKLYRFTVPPEVFKSGDIYPSNKGFCVEPGCLPSGLLNVSLCRPMNPPLVVSSPHFYQGNKSLLKTVNGLHPTKSAHETFLDVEPLTGRVMRAAQRLQINVALESTGEITDEKAKEFRSKVYEVIIIFEVFQYFLITLGVLCLELAKMRRNHCWRNTNLRTKLDGPRTKWTT
ncbi:Lysosome membrane protein 2 [Acropora cervicornis]|uniref:Lysosome membrane protein 2 n=1 Tax=Acropora cervicornis TaxID=6130 RepID=A0AAD9QLF9_ACRCE|nr:Lysosome membrane protein 2 [Acropora cervicornis]